MAEVIEGARYAIERSILAAMLGDWMSMSMAKQQLTVENFKSHQNRVLFTRLLEMYEDFETGMSGERPEFKVLQSKLESGISKFNSSHNQDFEFIGSTIGFMVLLETKTEDGSIQALISELQEANRAEYVDRAIDDLFVMRKNGATTEDLLQKFSLVEKFGLEGSDDPYVLLGSEEIETEYEVGISSGFHQIDNSNRTGGFPKGQTSIIAAYRGGFKTTLLAQAFEYTSRTQPSLFVTVTDNDSKRLLKRIMFNLTGTENLPLTGLEDQEDWKELKYQLQKRKTGIIDATKMRTKRYAYVENLIPKLEYHRRKDGLQSVFIDYFQRIKTVEKCNAYERQALVAVKLQEYAQNSGMAVVIGSQITDDNGKIITKGGRDIEEDAALVMLLQRAKDIPDTINVEFTKNRFGPQHMTTTFRYNKHFLRLE